MAAATLQSVQLLCHATVQLNTRNAAGRRLLENGGRLRLPSRRLRKQFAVRHSSLNGPSAFQPIRASSESNDGNSSSSSSNAPQDPSPASPSLAPEPPTTTSTAPSIPASTSSSFPYLPLTALSLVGAAETLYLSVQKMFGDGLVACPVGNSCNDVLSSPYASIMGIPLPLFGLAAYSSVAVLTQLARPAAAAAAAAGLSTTGTEGTEGSFLAGASRWALLSLTAMMAGSSGYLMFLLQTELDGASCLYCFGSAALSTLLFAVTVQSFSLRDLQKALLPQAALVAATVLALSLSFADVRSAWARDPPLDLPPIEPEVTTVSSPVRVQLAKHLADAGAKLYGAFWCSHCYEQKQAFGSEASKYLPYVECYPEGFRSGVKLSPQCVDAKIEGFPTWVIDGKILPGEQDLDELARLTAFNP